MSAADGFGLGATVGAGWLSGAERAEDTLAEVGAARFVAADFRPGTIRHVVLFRFAPTAAVSDVEAVCARFLTLAERCVRDGEPYIRSIESGLQSSTESAGDGFDRGFIVTFASEGDRNYYVGRPAVTEPGLVDEAHDAFKAEVGPLLDTAGVVVFDFSV